MSNASVESQLLPEEILRSELPVRTKTFQFLSSHALDVVSQEVLQRRAEIAARIRATREENEKIRQEENLKVIHVGVDYGTTYSGNSSHVTF